MAETNTVPATTTEAAAPVQAQVEQTAEQKTKAKPQKTGSFIIDTAGLVETLTKTKALNMADKLVEDIDNNSFVLGGVLQVIFDQGWFEGYETFGDFVFERFGFQERKARYLMEIYTHLTKKNIPWEKVQMIGWTKLKDLARYLTPENVDEWVKKASALTVKQLQDVLKSDGDKGGEEGSAKTTSDTTKLLFKVKNDQLDTIQAALAKAKAESNTDHDNVALELICAGYNAGTVGIAVKEKSLSETIQAAGWEAVLTTFGEVFPKINLKVEVPEGA